MCKCKGGLFGELISWNSEPDYDGWGPDTYWGCEEWRAYHVALKDKYGKEKANQIWVTAWDKQGAFDGPKNSCRYNTSFVDYLLKQGIDIRSFTSAIFTNVASSLVNVTETADNATDSLSTFGKQLKWLLPTAAVGLIVIGGIVIYNRAEKTAKLIEG